MSAVLKDQISFYESQVRSWADEFRDETHEKMVAERRQLCRLLEFGLFLYGQVHKIDEEWSHDVIAPSGEGVAAEPAAEIGALYSWWCKPCDQLLQRIDQIEARGYPIHIAQTFREACADARTKAAWDLNRVQAAEAQFNQGGGRPMGEVFDELRGHSHRSGD